LATTKTAWKIRGPIILTRLDVVGLFLLAVFPGRRIGRQIVLVLEGLAGVGFLWQAGLFCLVIDGLVRLCNPFAEHWNIYAWAAAGQNLAGMAGCLAFVAFWVFHGAGKRSWRNAMAWTIGITELLGWSWVWGLAAVTEQKQFPPALLPLLAFSVLRLVPWFMVALFEGKGGGREA